MRGRVGWLLVLAGLLACAGWLKDVGAAGLAPAVSALSAGPPALPAPASAAARPAAAAAVPVVAAGIPAARQAPAVSPASGGRQYVLNPGFEEGLTGWTGRNARIALTTKAAAGRWAARVRATRAPDFALVPARRPVTATSAGMRYTAAAWLRSDPPGVRRVCLRVREWRAGTAVLIGSTERCIVATARWQRVAPVAYRARSEGGELDLEVYSRGAGPTARFDVDEVTLVDEGPPPDTRPPAVALTAPPEGAMVEGAVRLAADADDDVGVERVEFLVDGTVVGSASAEPYELVWDSTALPDGWVEIGARAYDAAGNVGRAAPRAVRIENRVPDTALVSGPSGTVRASSATFRFSSDESDAGFECSLDGSPFEPCSSSHEVHVAAGSHVFRVRAVDPAGKADETPAERAWWADPLLQNGTFELPARGWDRQGYVVAGWRGHQASLAQVGGGIAGPGAARVTAVATGSDFSIYSSPKPVNASVAGREYVARGYVRSETPGRELCLAVREFTRSGELVARAQVCTLATATWQPFEPVSHRATASGNQIEVLVFHSEEAADGASFDVDGLTLDDGAADPVLPPQTGDPVLLATADVASCWSSGDEAVARLLDTLPGLIALAGDTEQNFGSHDEFAGCYEPAWGRHKWRTRPAVGDHEYAEPGAAGYFDYFGEAAGPPGQGWYSYGLGDWHVVVLNSNCPQAGGCGPGSEQYEWLKRDLAANARDCTAAYFHHPRWSSGYLHGPQTRVAPFWDLLYTYGADVVLGGNDQNYQRFAPQDPGGALDPQRGIRQFVVGTGGTILYRIDSPAPNLEAWNDDAFGVLRLTLRAESYDWEFVPQEGRSFSDSGSHACSVDRTAPTVALTSPPDGATVGGLVRLAAEAEDDVAIERVEFLVDGELVGTAEAPPYAVRWDATGAEGTVGVVARAVDTSRNVAESAPHTVTIAEAPIETTIDEGPEGTVASTFATFRFSADEDGATFECSLDGAAFADCSSPTTYAGLDNGPHMFRVQAISAAGSIDPTPAERTWTVDAPNLFPNGGFELGLDGWRGHRASLELLDGGVEGAHAARVLWTEGSDFSLFPSPRPVLATEAGRVYLADAWLRSETPGRPVCLRVREWAGSLQVGGMQECLTSTSDWARFPTVRYLAQGGTELDAIVFEHRAEPGDSFDVDGISLR